MVAPASPEKEFKSGFYVDETAPGGHKSWSGAVEALIKNLKRIKVWTWLSENNVDASGILAKSGNLEKAMEAMDDEESPEAKVKAKVLEALGIKEEVERVVSNPKMTLANIFDTEEKKELVKVEHNGETKEIEIWLDELSGKNDPDHELVEKIEKQMQILFEKVGPKELRGVSDGRALAELEDKIGQIQVLKEIDEAKGQSRLTGRKTAIGRAYEREINNTGSETLWRVRNASQTERTRLETLTAKVQEEAKQILTEDGLNGLTQQDLIESLDHVNDLRDNITSLLDRQMLRDDREKLRVMLLGIQAQYTDAIAARMVDGWKKAGRSEEEWGIDVARAGLRKTLELKRKGWSARIKWNNKENNKRWNEMVGAAEKQAKQVVERRRKKGYRVDMPKPEIGGGNTPSAEQFESMKKFKEKEAQLDRILGRGNIYNIFEDEYFWEDLASGNRGIEKIVRRAKPRDENGFRQILENMRKEREPAKLENLFRRPRYGAGEDDIEYGNENFAAILNKLIKAKRYGAAANVMLEYTTRVGIRETGQDLEFMMIRRNFLNKISKISPDFAAQFEINQMLGYLPDLASQKIEDFLASYQRLHSKGNLDIVLGDNAMMGANRLILEDGKEVTFSVKTVKSILRDERYITRVLSADPNTMDSTLQGIMLEEMFGRGTKVHMRVVDGKQELFLALPGQSEGDWRNLRDVKVKMRFADMGVAGFNGWSKTDIEAGADGNGISLEDALNRNQWILRDGMAMMWYSEDWKHIAAAKSYQTELASGLPKSLITSDVAKAVYQMHFGNVPPPMAEMVEVFGGMLSAMSVYKAKDMVGKNVARQLWKALGNNRMSEEDAIAEHSRFTEIGKLFVKMHVRPRSVRVEDKNLNFNNKLRTNEMARLAFNEYSEEGPEVLALLRSNFENLKMEGIPSNNELLEYYRRWKEAKKAGKVPEAMDGEPAGKSAYFGQEYDALWQEVKELQMTPSERRLWESLTHDELNVLWKMNDKTFGETREHVMALNPEDDESAVFAEMKKQFLKELMIGAFVAETGTTNGDDYQQFAMKYAPAKYEALKSLYKLASLRGSVEDLAAFIDQVQLFMEPGERLDSIALIENRMGLASSNQLLTPLRIPLSTSRKHQKEYPAWQLWHKGDDKMRGTNDIEWIKFTDRNNHTYFARTVNGDRAYEEEDYTGNWSSKELGVDFWRPSDMEIVNMELRARGLLDKHSMHLMTEKALGTYRDVEHVFGKFFDRMGLSAEKKHKALEAISGLTSKGKLLALKLFLFNDPKYAMWTLAHDVVGFGGKVFENIFGFSVSSGGGHGH